MMGNNLIRLNEFLVKFNNKSNDYTVKYITIDNGVKVFVKNITNKPIAFVGEVCFDSGIENIFPIDLYANINKGIFIII